MKYFMICGNWRSEQVFYHYKTGKWSFFDAWMCSRRGSFLNDGPFCNSVWYRNAYIWYYRLQLGLLEFGKIRYSEIETLKIAMKDFSVKILLIEKEWIKKLNTDSSSKLVCNTRFQG